MTPLLILGCYLLLFRSGGMTRIRRIGVFTVTALATASHPSHLGPMGGLLISASPLGVLAAGCPPCRAPGCNRHP